MPAATLITSLPYKYGVYPYPLDITLSRSGTTLDEILLATSEPSTGAEIYGPTGTLLASPRIPELRSIQVVSSDVVYVSSLSPVVSVSGLNEMISLTTGAVTWASGNLTTGLGAVAGSEAVFPSGNLVLTQPY